MNDAHERTYLDINQGTNDAPYTYPPTGADFHDFGKAAIPTGASKTHIELYIPGGYEIIATLHWDEPYGGGFAGGPGSQADLDMYLVSNLNLPLTTGAGGNVVAEAHSIQGVPGSPAGDAVEYIQFLNPPTSPSTFYLVVNHSAGRKTDLKISVKIIIKIDDPIIDKNLFQDRTIYGHKASANTMAVAAMDYKEILDPSHQGTVRGQRNVETYSSLGGSNLEIWFSPDGNTRFQTPQLRAKPDITAPDAIATSFFSGGTFRGTSAAAPHVAAVAALILSGRHSPPDQLYSSIRNFAKEAETTGWDALSGSGIVDALPTFTDKTRVRRVPQEHPTIQKAIAAASNGETILVSPGVYRENINFLGKDVVVRSRNPLDRDDVEGTVIHGRNRGPVVTFSGSEPRTARLAGFTIRDGKATTGGGIFGQHTQATIENNRIVSNVADNGGGIAQCDGTVRRNVIRDNVALIGGGGVFDCDGTIADNRVAFNVARTGNGGGLLSCGSGSSFIVRNLVFENEARFRNTGGNGGGLAECQAHIWNNVIYNNRAKSTLNGGGTYQCTELWHNTIAYNTAAVGGGIDSATAISHCIVWGNAGGQINNSGAPTSSCIQAWAGGGTGNITSDPQFVNVKGDNYRIKDTSPCKRSVVVINSPSEQLGLDFEGDLRPLPLQIPDTTTMVSIGADEVQE